MTRLSTLRSSVTALKPRVGYAQGDERAFDRQRASTAGRSWYKTARWQRLRMRVFERDLFTCQMPGCGKLEGNTSLLVCDHKRPHRGDERLFWDEGNLWTLCKPCHDVVKQREDQRGRGA